eukprot:scaffold127788_cov21-Tisochrysis_lutea.AAC.1
MQRKWGQPAPFFLSQACNIYFAYLSFESITMQYSVDQYLHQMGPMDYVFLLLTWHKCGLDAKRYQQYQEFPCQIIVCANTPEEHQLVQQAKQRFPRLRSIYFNQNAMLDPALFSIREPAAARPPFQYSLLVNSCFAAFKRTYLTSSVQGTIAHIGY